MSRFLLPALCLLATLLGQSYTMALAEDSAMKIGVEKYRAKNFSEAAGYFGLALPNEFYNPSLHYHLANCMVHMRQKEAAIREYRIAYALFPTGTVGEYSRLCLAKFGIDATGIITPGESAIPRKISSRY